MDIATIIGFIVGLGLILFGMVDSVTKTIPQTFLNYQGIAIVLGGTTAATLINYPLKKILSLFKVAGLTFRGNSVESENEIISTLVEYKSAGAKQLSNCHLQIYVCVLKGNKF